MPLSQFLVMKNNCLFFIGHVRTVLTLEMF